MKIKFLGVGGAFAPISKGNSNMMLTADNGERLMIDFGATAVYIYKDEWGLNLQDIDAVYVSHLHGDHTASLEHLAFHRYFMPKRDKDGNIIRPKLYCVPELMTELWETTLKGGLQSIEGKVMNITDYFDCRPVNINSYFNWNAYKFEPVQTVHVMSGYKINYSYGLMITGPEGSLPKSRVFITTDTQFCPYQLIKFYSEAKTIFHDCETLVGFRSHVHAHFSDLCSLNTDIKAKMWLYHYGDKLDASSNGFAGFVDKGQEFDI